MSSLRFLRGKSRWESWLGKNGESSLRKALKHTYIHHITVFPSRKLVSLLYAPCRVPGWGWGYTVSPRAGRPCCWVSRIQHRSYCPAEAPQPWSQTYHFAKSMQFTLCARQRQRRRKAVSQCCFGVWHEPYYTALNQPLSCRKEVPLPHRPTSWRDWQMNLLAQSRGQGWWWPFRGQAAWKITGYLWVTRFWMVYLTHVCGQHCWMGEKVVVCSKKNKAPWGEGDDKLETDLVGVKRGTVHTGTSQG